MEDTKCNCYINVYCDCEDHCPTCGKKKYPRNYPYTYPYPGYVPPIRYPTPINPYNDPFHLNKPNKFIITLR